MNQKFMFNIRYSDQSFLSVDSFILYLKNYYKRIYFDTWIVTEDIIVWQYIIKTEELFDEIINKIEETISKWVYWVILETKTDYELSKLVISVRSYNIVVLVKRTNDDFEISDIKFN